MRRHALFLVGWAALAALALTVAFWDMLSEPIVRTTTVTLFGTSPLPPRYFMSILLYQQPLIGVPFLLLATFTAAGITRTIAALSSRLLLLRERRSAGTEEEDPVEYPPVARSVPPPPAE